MTRSEIDVVVAVLVRPDGRCLLARRPEGRAMAGFWEFPGGKIEPGETREAALARELEEELGIRAIEPWPWIARAFAYPHARVRLYFYRVTAWEGEPREREGQRLAWVNPAAPAVAPLLPANHPVLEALCLPPVMGVSHVAELTQPVFLARLEAALAQGLRLVQIREHALGEAELAHLVAQVRRACARHGALVVVNAAPDVVARLACDGVHLSASRLMASKSRPPLPWVGASCHDPRELEHAARLELDYVVLGPVLPTQSHPGAKTLGWEGFARLVEDYPLPVYAIGGMRAEALPHAWRHGAHGVAMLRGAW